MKDIQPKLIKLFKEGYCTPQISKIAKKLKEPSTTIHYNIKRLEKEKAIIGYKAVFNHKKIEESFGCFVLINLSPDEYGNPESIARELGKHPEIESINIITGDWEMILKVRTKDQEAYYDLIKRVISRKGVTNIKSLTSLKEIKNESIVL